MRRDQVMRGVAFWVEKTHAETGWLFIAQQRDWLLADGDLDGAALWQEVSWRYDELSSIGPNGPGDFH